MKRAPVTGAALDGDERSVEAGEVAEKDDGE